MPSRYDVPGLALRDPWLGLSNSKLNHRNISVIEHFSSEGGFVCQSALKLTATKHSFDCTSRKYF